MVTLTIASRVYFFSYVLCVRASFFTIVPLHFTHLFALFFLSYRFLYFLNDWVPVFRFGLPLLCASAVRLLCVCCAAAALSLETSLIETPIAQYLQDVLCV